MSMDGYGRPTYPAWPTYLPQRTNGLAIASFVLGLLGMVLLPVIFGHLALRQIESRRDSGTAFAVIGLVLGYLGLIGWLLLATALATALGWGAISREI